MSKQATKFNLGKGSPQETIGKLLPCDAEGLVFMLEGADENESSFFDDVSFGEAIPSRWGEVGAMDKG